MTSFSLFVIIVVVVAGLMGLRAGLIKQVGRLAGIILGIAACRIFAPTVVTTLGASAQSGSDKVLYTILSYVLVFIVVYVGVSLVGGLIRKMLSAVSLGFVDRLAGAAFTILEALLLLSLALNLWVAVVPGTTLVGDPWFDRVLMFGPYLLDAGAVLKAGTVVGTATQG